MITNCNTCGRAYDVASLEEADDPNRTCLACHYQDREYRIDNIYPADGNQTRTAFLMFTGVAYRRAGLSFGLAQCVGSVEYDRATGGWSVSINTPYDPETDSDSREIGTYESRERALGVLWSRRHEADWEF